MLKFKLSCPSKKTISNLLFSNLDKVSFDPSTVLKIPRSILPTVEAFSEIILKEFHSLLIFPFFFKNDLIASKIYFPVLDNMYKENDNKENHRAFYKLMMK